MFRRAQRAVLTALLTLIPSLAAAQTVWQPTQPPAVTAETSSWYVSAEPISINGELYYPAGAVTFFNGFQMVRSGSFNGIPLYMDPGFQPDTTVFVPLSGGRMQPYQRRQPGTLAALNGGPLPAFTGRPLSAFPAVASVPGLSSDLLSQVANTAPQSVGTTAVQPVGNTAPRPVGTSGRVAAAAAPSRASTLNPPRGVNGVWINFDGRRWFSAGKAIDYDAAILTRVGTYRGWNVYMRDGDRTTIYVPGVPGKLSPYRSSLNLKK
jgi:hypothetical protein